MGSIKLIVYMQKSINNIFYLLYTFIKAYINYIMTSAHLFKKHIADLQSIFYFCTQFNISIKLTKIFFYYFSVNFLVQFMNLLGFTIVKNKITAVKVINNLATLSNLKYFWD